MRRPFHRPRSARVVVRLVRAAAAVIAAALTLPVDVVAQSGGATRTWVGGQSGNRWSVAENWSPSGVPQSADHLVFGQDGQNQKSMDNDLPAFVAGSVTVQTSGYRVGGLGLTLAAGSISSISGGEFAVASLAGAGILNFANSKLVLEQVRNTTFDGALIGSELVLQGGSGTLTYTGDGSRIQNGTTIQRGGLILDGGSLGRVSVEQNGTLVLRDDASTGPVFVNGGQFGRTSSGVGSVTDFTLNGAPQYTQPISSATDYGQVIATGQVSLTGTLSVQLLNGYIPPVGTVFTIIRKDSAGRANNNFTGLPEGTEFNSGSVKFRISYVGNDGNDVILTVVEAAPPASPDVSVTKRHQQQFEQGGQGTYLIDVTNVGTASTAGTITMTDTLPAALTPRTATGDGWSCAVAQTVTCTRTTALAAGAASQISIDVDVSASAPSTVTNTAVVSGGGDTSPGNNSSTAVTPVAARTPSLAIAKSHDGPFTQGQSGAAFTIVISNTGTGGTSGSVAMTDTLPAGLAPTAASGSGWSCGLAGQTVTCTRADRLAPGSSYPAITLTVDVAANAVSTSNTATVSGGGDPLEHSATDPVTIVGTPPDLTITKTHAPPVVQGGRVVFSIVVRNAGSTTTTGEVVVSDRLPEGLTHVAVSGDGWSCTAAADLETCRRSDALAGGNTAYPPITLTADVAFDAPATVVNEVTVSGGGDMSPGNNTASDTVRIGSVDPDLTITKTHDGALTPGQRNVPFTIDVRNVGSAPTRGDVLVIDHVPAGLTPISAAGDGWSCGINGQVMACGRLDPLAPGAAYPSLVLRVDVALDATSGTNVADVSGGGDVSPGNNTARDGFVVSGVPDLTIAKSHAPATFVPGAQGTYTLRVSNVGTSDTFGTVTVEDTLPRGFVPVAVEAQGWGCNLGSPVVACLRSDTLGPGQEYPVITIRVQLAADATDGTNTATVAGGGDVTPANNTAKDFTPVQRTVDLAIAKRHDQQFEQGGEGRYVIDVVNLGTAATSALVTVTDAIDPALTVRSASGDGWLCTPAQTVTCTRTAALAPGPAPSITIVVGVSPAAPPSIQNTATVTTDDEAKPEDNSTTIVTPVAPRSPTLRIAKSHDDPFQQGQIGATFTLTVSNLGPGSTTGLVSVADTLPAGLAPTAASGTGWTCGVNGSTATCTRSDSLGPVAAFEPITLTVNVAPDATSTTNSATVSGGGSAPHTDSDPVTITGGGIASAPDLTLTKTHTGAVVQGGTVSFAIVVRNAGGVETVGDIVVVDTLPAGLSPTAANGPGWSCDIAAQTVTCRRSDVLGSGGTFPQITLTADVAPTATTVINVVIVSGGGDVSPGNNTASDTITIGEVAPDLTITKSHEGPFAAGARGVPFTIQVRNVGGAPSRGTVTVHDAMPAGLTPVAADGNGWLCAIAGQLVTCTRDDALAPGSAFADLVVRADVASNATSGVNTVDVSGGGDVTPDNNIARDPFVVSGPPNLTIAKSHDNDFVQGQTGALYTIEVRNAGGTPTTGDIVMVDRLPAGLRPTGAGGDGWACAIQGQTVTCQRSDPIAPQQRSLITIAVDVSESASDVINIAVVSGGGDTTPEDNIAADPTPIRGRPQLSIAKAHAAPVVQGQRGVQFTLSVVNNGTGPTAGTVVVTDPFPAGLVPVDAVGVGWTCNRTAQLVRCVRADALDAGASYAPIHITVDVAADATSTVNEAFVDGGGDTTPDDNVARDLVAISVPGAPNLVIAKEHDGPFFQGQQGAIYRVQVSNRGQAATAGPVTVTDDVPAGLTPTRIDATGWGCGIAGHLVTCARDDSLPSLATWPTIHIVVDVAPTATSVVNVAVVSGGGDPTITDNTATDATTVLGRRPDLAIVKSHTGPFVSGQIDAAWRIAVSNVGSAPTVGEVVVTDDVPAGFTPRSATGDGWSCTIAGQFVTCRRGDSLPASSAYPDIMLIVNVGLDASNATNVAMVSGGGDDTPANNVWADFTNVNGSVDATIALSLASNLVIGQTADYVARVTSLGPGTIGGMVRVVTDVPDALAPMIGIGSGWQCQTAGQQFLCARLGLLAPGATLPDLTFRVLVRDGPGQVTTTTVVNAPGDVNQANDRASVTTGSTVPVSELRITKQASVDRVMAGGSVAYRIDVSNVGDTRVSDVVVSDLLPRGFELAGAVSQVRATNRSDRGVPAAADGDSLEWSLQTLNPGETASIIYRVVVGPTAGQGPQENRATATGIGWDGATVATAPAVATVEVTGETFSMLQAIVGRVYEDLDRDGTFTSSDRPIAGARVITSTGQASITDPDGLYNVPSIGSGSVVISIDRATIPGHLTPTDDGPGGQSWTRLLRTPVGGGTLLRQNFALARAEGATADVAPEVVAIEPSSAPEVLPEASAGDLPPRREYRSRLGSSVLVALGEVSAGQAAPEMALFSQDSDAWGYASVFFQGPIGSSENRLTLAYDSHRRLNGTGNRERLFELDPNDRLYPVFGDTSVRQELATANSKFFGRLERGGSHVMYGDLVGDLPSSDRNGGRWSSYQRHLTGVEVRLADARGNHVTLRGAQPETAYARDVFSVSSIGLINLSRDQILAGTETIAIEVRDRRTPERVLSREILARGVDYELDPQTGSVFIRRYVPGLDSALNLVQIVATYEYQSTGTDNAVAGGRTQWTMKGLRLGGTVFTEQAASDGRFTLAGIDLEQQLPNGGVLRVDLPYSRGIPDVTTSVDARPVDANGRQNSGVGVQAEVDQPLAFWSGRLKGALVGAGAGLRNPFGSTITPGARYATAAVELSPRAPSQFQVGVTDERYSSSSIDAHRTTLSGAWSETVARSLTLTAGYDARHLENAGDTVDSGLFTGAARVSFGDRVEARVAREQNLRDSADPTYPDQTTLGARVKVGAETSIVYAHRISDHAIEPIGDFSGTGVSRLPTRGELSLGVESRVADTTRVTSGYRVEQAINGPDAFALLGVSTQIDLTRGFSGTVGAERGQLVDGDGDSYTSGTLALAYLAADRFKASARYEARAQDGFAGMLTAGLAARFGAGITGLVRGEWLESPKTGNQSMAILSAVAVRPTTHDRAGALFSYQYTDRDQVIPTFGGSSLAPGWRHRLSTDAYAQPWRRVELHGKFAWQRNDLVDSLVTDTYLGQARGRVTISRLVDAAVEERYIRQPISGSARRSTGMEVGFWPIADVRLALGYHLQDTRDPHGRDREGRARGFYFTFSTKLSHLFNLLGTAPAPAAVR